MGKSAEGDCIVKIGQATKLSHNKNDGFPDHILYPEVKMSNYNVCVCV